MEIQQFPQEISLRGRLCPPIATAGPTRAPSSRRLSTARRTLQIALLLLGLFCGVHQAASAARESIDIGVATSLSTMEGEESFNAVRLAVDEINAHGGVQLKGKGIPFKVRSIDLRDALPGVTVEGAVNRFENFVQDAKPGAVVVGPFRSEVLLAGMDMMAESKIPILGTIAMTAASEAMVIRNPKYRNIFRVSLDSKYLVDCLIHVMKFLNQRFGFRKVFIVHQDVAWARASVAMMIRLFFNRAGWDVVGLESFPSGASDFSGALRKAQGEGAEVILPIFDMPESVFLVKQWSLMRVPALLCGYISPMVGPSAWKVFDGQIAGALNLVFELGNVPSRKYEPAARFYRAYEKKYGREIESGHGPAPSYEAVYILKDAIEKTGTLDREQVVSALEETDRTSSMGRIRFHKGHQAIFGNRPGSEALACVVQWREDGQRRIVYPTSVAEGEIELPDVVRARK